MTSNGIALARVQSLAAAVPSRRPLESVAQVYELLPWMLRVLGRRTRGTQGLALGIE